MIQQVTSEKSEIWLVTLEKEASEFSEIRNELKQIGINWYPIRYSRFGVRMMIRWVIQFFGLLSLIFRKKINAIHAWCTPAGAIGYWLSVFSGKPLIIDSYEPHAESSVENGEWQRDSLAFKVLFWHEKKQSLKAKKVIAVSSAMEQYAKEKYSAHFKEFYIKPAGVDLQKFEMIDPDPVLVQSLNLKDKIVCIYAGKVGGIYFDEEIFILLKSCFDRWGDRFRMLFLTPHPESEIVKKAQEVGLPRESIIVKFAGHDEVASYMSLADFAINPVKPVPSKKCCTSIKDGEYWAMGLPVIIPPNISDDSDIIANNNIGVVIENWDHSTISKGLDALEALLSKDRLELRKKIRGIAEQYRSFDKAAAIYKKIYG